MISRWLEMQEETAPGLHSLINKGEWWGEAHNVLGDVAKEAPHDQHMFRCRIQSCWELLTLHEMESGVGDGMQSMQGNRIRR